MNILPHKSWHVRRKENVAKVRRDEKQAAEEAVENEKKQLKYVKERRMKHLRDNNSEKSHNSKNFKETRVDLQRVSEGYKKHVNFFDNFENGDMCKGNKVFEADKKKDAEKEERKIGVLTYLGQSVIESQKTKRWFEKIPTDRKDLTIDEIEDVKDDRYKSRNDPLNSILMYEKLRNVDQEKSRDKQNFLSRCNIEKGGIKKHKKERRSKSKLKKIYIDDMRRERLDREAHEKYRRKELLGSSGSKSHSKSRSSRLDERNLPFNQTFNSKYSK